MKTVKFKCIACGHTREIKFNNIHLRKYSNGYRIDFDGISYKGDKTRRFVNAVCPNIKCVKRDIAATFTIHERERRKLVAILV